MVEQTNEWAKYDYHNSVVTTSNRHHSFAASYIIIVLMQITTMLKMSMLLLPIRVAAMKFSKQIFLRNLLLSPVKSSSFIIDVANYEWRIYLHAISREFGSHFFEYSNSNSSWPIEAKRSQSARAEGREDMDTREIWPTQISAIQRKQMGWIRWQHLLKSRISVANFSLFCGQN